MSKIDVNISESRIVNARLLPIRDIVDGVVNQLINLQSSIDPRVLNQNNLRERLNVSRNNIASIESDLRNLHSSIVTILNRYEETENQILSKIPGQSLGAGSSANRAAFALGTAIALSAPSRVVDNSMRGTTSALRHGKSGADIFNTGASVNGIANFGMLRTTKSGNHIIISGSNNARMATGVKGTRFTTSTFTNQVSSAATNKGTTFAGNLSIGMGVAYGGAVVISSIRNDIASGASVGRVVGNAGTAAGGQVASQFTTKKTVGATTKGGAKIGAKAGLVLGPKGAVVGAAAGAIVGAAVGVVTSGAITSIGRNVVSGTANMARNVFNRFRR